ncbi:MAG: S-adenosylmethionine:tRNA ribosyltransferase-isomerase [Cytophagales bacterium]
MKLSLFEFKLLQSLIASHPTLRRDDICLVVANRATRDISFYTMRDFPKFFNPYDTVIINDTRVARSHLRALKEKTNSTVDVVFLREIDPNHHLYEVSLDPARKIRIGNKLHLGGVKVHPDGTVESLLRASVIDNTESRGRTLLVDYKGSSEELNQILFQQLGHPPIPSFMGRSHEPIDKQRYQTVYAKHRGSVAPPSAGFAFTPYLLKYLELHDVHIAPITLHLSINRFKTIEAEELNKFRVDSEYYNIPAKTAEMVNQCLLRPKNKICVVGTSSLKAVESAISYEDNLKAGDGMSCLFLHPPFKPKIATSLLTGFHNPRTIDFVNFLAFAGHDFGMEIYEHALEDGLRFGPYGDVVLVL